MNKLKAWFSSHSITTHSIAAGITAAVAAYYQVPQFHKLVLDVYGKFPTDVKELVATAIALVGFYYKSQSSQETK